jgi:SAM-dependent methyltransferase
MFLSRQATQAEYTDSLDLPFAEVADNYRQLAKVNRFLLFSDPFTRHLARWLGKGRCRRLSILDLGAGDGSLGREITAWAEQRGWTWRVINLDLNPLALRLNPAGHNVAASALALPFSTASFDVVIASQMTHHLAPAEQVIQHWREAWRVSRDALFVSDLHRNAGLYGILWLLMVTLRLPLRMFRDGLLSVRRGWRVGEWKALASAAGIEDARVWIYFGSRIMLQARRRNGHVHCHRQQRDLVCK